MIEIFEYIKKLDESGNYRLADKLDNEVRKIYSQTLNQLPGVSGYTGFVLNQLVQNKMKPEDEETDTLSPQKDSDVNTIRKQVNKIISDTIMQNKKIKDLETGLGTLPGLEGKIGEVSELNNQFNTKINDNTINIDETKEDVMTLQDSVDSLL
jgi:hypothetical protein